MSNHIISKKVSSISNRGLCRHEFLVPLICLKTYFINDSLPVFRIQTFCPFIHETLVCSLTSLQFYKIVGKEGETWICLIYGYFTSSFFFLLQVYLFVYCSWSNSFHHFVFGLYCSSNQTWMLPVLCILRKNFFLGSTYSFCGFRF